MNIVTPAQVAANRTARLVREAHTPVYSTTTPSRDVIYSAVLRAAESFAGPEFCHICGRATEHFGEHSDEQLAAFANSPLGMALMS